MSELGLLVLHSGNILTMKSLENIGRYPFFNLFNLFLMNFYIDNQIIMSFCFDKHIMFFITGSVEEGDFMAVFISVKKYPA